MQKLFDEWFEKNYPPESFGYLSGAFRTGLKNDIAAKAFSFGLQNGFDTNFDRKLFNEVEDYLKDK